MAATHTSRLEQEAICVHVDTSSRDYTLTTPGVKITITR